MTVRCVWVGVGSDQNAHGFSVEKMTGKVEQSLTVQRPQIDVTTRLEHQLKALVLPKR